MRKLVPALLRRVVLPSVVVCAACAGCESPHSEDCRPPFPPATTYPADHRYTLDELIDLSVQRNASLDVARYEAEAAAGLVDQVKALWLPSIRFDFVAAGYSNDLSYKARAFDLVSINVPLTGAYNFFNSVSLTQILSTGGKRTSGLKQARMFEAIKRLDVLRQQDAVAFDVATYYHLVCLTTDVDGILEDATRRLRVFRQVAENLNRRGSLRASDLDRLEADYFISQLEQFRTVVQAGRQQAYEALRHFVGVAHDEPLTLRQATLAAPLTPREALSAYGTVIKGFLGRPENKQVDLFTKIREEQVKFAKAAWKPNIALLGAYTDTEGNHHPILNAIDGLIVSAVVDIPIYDAGRLGRLREALGFEQASLAFQREVESLITLEIDVTAIDAQKALANLLKADRAARAAAEHYDATRQAYSRELVPASSVVTAIALDMIAKIQQRQALFTYHDAHARVKRVTADRERQYGY